MTKPGVGCFWGIKAWGAAESQTALSLQQWTQHSQRILIQCVAEEASTDAQKAAAAAA